MFQVFKSIRHCGLFLSGKNIAFHIVFKQLLEIHGSVAIEIVVAVVRAATLTFTVF